jgi:hypothetical protein
MELNPPRLTIFAPAYRTGRRLANAGDVLVHVGSFQTVGGNEGVDVEAARVRADNRADLDMTNGSGRNPGKDVLDLVVRNRRTLRSAQHRDYVGSGPPTFLMADEGEIERGLPWRVYTGS